jgi:hypothetical protein
LLAPGPPRAIALTGIEAWLTRRRRAVTQQTVPVKRQVRMGVFKRLTHFGIQGLAADLDM